MMGKVVPVASLTNRSRRVRIQERVVKIWQTVHAITGHTFGMHFLLLDGKDCAVQGFISVKDYQMASHLFIEGNIFEFARFTVEHAKSSYRVVDNFFSLLFTKETTVVPLPGDFLELPLLFFDVKRLEDIGIVISGNKQL